MMLILVSRSLGAGSDSVLLSCLEQLKAQGVPFKCLVPGSQVNALGAFLPDVDVLMPPQTLNSRPSPWIQKMLAWRTYARAVARYSAMYPFTNVHAVGLGAQVVSAWLRGQSGHTIHWCVEELPASRFWSGLMVTLSQIIGARVWSSSPGALTAWLRDRRMRGKCLDLTLSSESAAREKATVLAQWLGVEKSIPASKAAA
jgi:hypothetical protein